MVDFERQRWRSRLEGTLLAASAEGRHEAYGVAKATAIGAMEGTVVEIGPGVGANLRYYAPGVRVIAIEPNPHYHDRLRRAADEQGVEVEIRSDRAEAMSVDDGEAGGVVSSLVMCGVDDAPTVLREVRRIMAPGETFFFVEHVAGDEGSWTRRAQRVLRRPHGWLFNGCNPMRDIGSMIRVAGFSEVSITERDEGLGALHCRPHIVGTATA